jgi:hypothetical protein
MLGILIEPSVHLTHVYEKRSYDCLALYGSCGALAASLRSVLNVSLSVHDMSSVKCRSADKTGINVYLSLNRPMLVTAGYINKPAADPKTYRTSSVMRTLAICMAS